MVIEIVVETKDIEEGSCARLHHHVANVRVERCNLRSSRSFVGEMSRAGHGLKIGPRHCGKTGELTALSAKQASRRSRDRCAVQTATQVCTNAATGAQAHAHRVIKPFSKALEILFW